MDKGLRPALRSQLFGQFSNLLNPVLGDSEYRIRIDDDHDVLQSDRRDQRAVRAQIGIADSAGHDIADQHVALRILGVGFPKGRP